MGRLAPTSTDARGGAFIAARIPMTYDSARGTAAYAVAGGALQRSGHSGSVGGTRRSHQEDDRWVRDATPDGGLPPDATRARRGLLATPGAHAGKLHTFWRSMHG